MNMVYKKICQFYPDPDLDLDPHSSKSLDPDPHVGNECGSDEGLCQTL
jgi:hypothetical protein